jgi:hypothetical protein
VREALYRAIEHPAPSVAGKFSAKQPRHVGYAFVGGRGGQRDNLSSLTGFDVILE